MIIKTIKAFISQFADVLLLAWADRKKYWQFFFYEFPVINTECKRQNVIRLRPAHMGLWKLKYGTAYYSGLLRNGQGLSKVFIKIQGPLLQDCFSNEITVNRYIKEYSDYLYQRCPKIISSFSAGEHTVIIYEYMTLEPVSDTAAFQSALSAVLDEYRRIGIVHTDFGLSNMGEKDGRYFFFDYGTALCPDSDCIRIRQEYNHIDKAPDRVKQMLDDANYYYDDAVHFGIMCKECNFIVGNDTQFLADLGGKRIWYRASGTRTIKILKKEEEQRS